VLAALTRRHPALNFSEMVMTARTLTKGLLAVAVGLGVSIGAHAASVVFYADKLTADTPQDARDEFLKASTGVQSEGFETSPVGIPNGPLAIYKDTGSLTQGRFDTGNVLQGAPKFGRFNTTPGCDVRTACKWWETPYSFEIKLNSLKSAFAFFATDLGDLGGAISLDFWNDTTQVRSGIAVTQPTQTAGLLFFGWIDDTFSFNRISVNVTQTSSDPTFYDGIGFDDVLAGLRASPQGSTPVSAPTSLALVALSLGLLRATRRRNPPAQN
jgi:hypothetical protein